MKILVSACLAGVNCKYNGGNNLDPQVVEFIMNKDVIKICPELLAGMKTPRECAEIVDGIVTTASGENVDEVYRTAVKFAMKKIENSNIELAILQSRSPTCGVNEIYDGSFSGKLIHGQGLFAKALKEKGIPVVDADDFKNQFNLG